MGDHVNAIEGRLAAFEIDVRAEVTHLKSRVDTVESGAKPCEPFNPEVTIVASGLGYSQGEDILAKAKDLIANGVHLETQVVNAERTQSREGRPGIVKIEFLDVDSKVQVLRAKLNLTLCCVALVKGYLSSLNERGYRARYNRQFHHR